MWARRSRQRPPPRLWTPFDGRETPSRSAERVIAWAARSLPQARSISTCVGSTGSWNSRRQRRRSRFRPARAGARSRSALTRPISPSPSCSRTPTSLSADRCGSGPGQPVVRPVPVEVVLARLQMPPATRGRSPGRQFVIELPAECLVWRVPPRRGVGRLSRECAVHHDDRLGGGRLRHAMPRIVQRIESRIVVGLRRRDPV